MSRLVSLGRAAGGVGIALGVAAAGAAVGFAAERYVVGRSLRGEDPYADEPLGSLRGAPHVVHSDDGVRLHVEVDDVDDPSIDTVTIVFTHGYALNLDSWHFQRRDLRGRARLVFWDQRSHGRSSRAPDGELTFHRMARDLGQVLDEVGSTGPVVLVGHSMGGMTTLALAEEHPELIGDRIAAVALVASSAQAVSLPSLGVPMTGPATRLAHRIAPGVVSTLARRPELIEQGRRAGADLSYVLTRRYSFEAGGSPSLVEFTAAMNAATPIEVVAEFLPLFSDNDRTKALEVLQDLPVLIVGADGDRLTPIEHSRSMAEALPNATYLEVAESGHMVILERHDVVTNGIVELIDDVRASVSERKGKRWWRKK